MKLLEASTGTTTIVDIRRQKVEGEEMLSQYIWRYKRGVA